MKNITLLLLIAFTTTSFSQLTEVKETESIEIGRSGYNISLHKIGDDMYSFVYSNNEYKSITDIQSFQIVETGNDIESFYKILNNFIIDKPKDIKKFEVYNGDSILLSYSNAYRGVRIIHYSGGYKKGETVALNTKDIDLLFGKPKRTFKEAKQRLK